MGDTKAAEVPLNVRYDTRLGAVMDWIDIDMVRMTEHLAESEASAATQKRHSAGRALSVNIHAGIEPPVAGIRLQGRSSILERKRGGMPRANIHIYLGSIIDNCISEDEEQIDSSLIEERLSEEVIRQLNVYSETLQDFSELGFIKRLKKHYREIVSTQNSLAVESLTEQLKPKQSLKAAAVNIGSLAVGGMVPDLITSISPGGGAAETVLGLSAGFLAYFNTQRIARRNDSDLREREDIKRQIKYLNNERLLGATQLKAAARAGRYVLESGNFCALNFKQVETPLAEAA